MGILKRTFLFLFLFFENVLFNFFLFLAQDCVDSRLRAGKCVTLVKCPDMVQEYYDEVRKTSYATDFQTFMSNSICGFDGMNFMVSQKE